MSGVKHKQLNSRVSEELFDRIADAAKGPEYQPGGKSEFARRAFEAELARGAGLLEATERDLVVNSRTGETFEVHDVEAAVSVPDGEVQTDGGLEGVVLTENGASGQVRAAAAGVTPIDLADWILGRPGWADRYPKGKLNYLIFGGRVLVGGRIHRRLTIEPGLLGQGVEVAGEPVL